jgi:RNA polymerase sigma-70 factor, ECF subfamily
MSTPQPIDVEHFSCVARAWETHEKELRGYLRHRLADTAAADDLLQDVFVRAMRQGQGFCTLDNPRAWLFQVARNALIDRTRKSRTFEPLPDELVAPEPEATAAVDELAGCLASCMGALAVEDAEILRACDLEGQSAREFAAARNLTLAAAKSRLLRARQRLRAQLITACQIVFDASGKVDNHMRHGTGDRASG